MYASFYDSPLGKMLIMAEEDYLTGIWFLEQKYYPTDVLEKVILVDNQIIKDAKRWLDIYFRGHNPDFNISIKLEGTDFQKKVWQQLLEIPFGETTTYGKIAKALGIKSYQAVGSAISKNKISIIVPCHRVIGTNGNLTGYAGGLDKKEYLLNLEKRGYNDKSR